MSVSSVTTKSTTSTLVAAGAIVSSFNNPDA